MASVTPYKNYKYINYNKKKKSLLKQSMPRVGADGQTHMH